MTAWVENRKRSYQVTGIMTPVTYAVVDSPIGRLLLATTPTGLVRIAFEDEGFQGVVDALALRFGQAQRGGNDELSATATELDEYFLGKRREFDIPLDTALSSGFYGTVHHYLRRIPYGHTVTYRDVAEGIGKPAAVRAVGTACSTNPLPVVVPCHRVVRADGARGGYLGGAAAKVALLSLESASPATRVS